MAKQVSSSVWTDDTEINLFIDMFLKLLLKYEYVWCEQDERTFRISLPEHKRMLFAEDFLEFQKGLTSFDMAIQTRKIRKLYNEELMELQKSGKSINDSKLFWLSKAHRLFSNKTDEKKEVLSQEGISNSSDNPAVNKSNVNLRNFDWKSRKTASSTPTQVPSFSKTAMVASMTNMTTVLTITAPSLQHAVNPFLTVNPNPDAARQCMKTTAEFSSPKQVVTTINCSTGKTCLRAVSKVSSVSSPFKMVATPSPVRHPFHPPTCMSPISRIPLRRRTIHSTVSVPLTPTTKTSDTRSPHLSNLKSSTDRKTSQTIYRSLSFQNRFPRNVPSQDKAPISPAVIPHNSCVPRPTTTALPRYQEPIYMNIQYPRMTPPLNKPHEPSTSNIPKAPYLPATSCLRYKESSIASSSRVKAFGLHNKYPPPYNFDVPSELDTKSSRIVVPLSYVVPSCSNISTSAIPPSGDDVSSTVSTTREPSLSISLSSRIGASFLNNNPPPSYKPNVSAPVIATTSKITPILNVAASCSSNVSMSSTSSTAADSVTVSTPIYRAPSTSISSSTRSGNFIVYNKSPAPYNPEVPPTLIITSSRSPVSVSNISVKSNSEDSMSPFSLSSDDVLTSASTSCSHGSTASDGSRDGLFLLPNKLPPPYEPKTPISLAVPSSRTMVPLLQIVPSISSPSSRINTSSLNNKPPLYYKPNVSVPSVTISSKITPSILNGAPSCSSDVSMSSPSSRAGVSVTVTTPKYRAPSTSTSSSSRCGTSLVYESPPPYSIFHLLSRRNLEVLPTSITTSPRTLVSVSDITVKSNSGVSMPPLSSSIDDVPTSASTSCSHGSIASDDSRNGLSVLSYRLPPPYEPKTPTSLVFPSSRTTVSPLQIIQSSSHGAYTEAGISSNTSLVTQSFSDRMLAISPPSSIDIMSEAVSFNGVPTITPYRSPLPSKPKVPTSTFGIPSEAQVSSSLTSPSTSLQVLIPNVSFSSSGLPLSPTSPYSRTGVISSTFRTSVSLSPADSGVPPSPMLVCSPTETPLPSPSPLITEIEFVF